MYFPEVVKLLKQSNFVQKFVVSIESVKTNHTQCSTQSSTRVLGRLWEPQAAEIESTTKNASGALGGAMCVIGLLDKHLDKIGLF